MSGSLVHESLSALVAAWRAVSPAGLRVIDGPAYDPPEHFLAVGWDRTDQPSVTAVASSVVLSGVQNVESFDVSSLLSASYDADEVTTVRGQLFAAFDVFAAALAADQRLMGLVMSVQITDYDLTPILTEAGSVMDLRFTTHIEACK